MTETVPVLAGYDLVKRYGGARNGGHLAVDGVTIEVFPGETVGVVGESGCGKSTTARLLLGLVAATSGTVMLEGIEPESLHGRRRREARARAQLVPQNPQTSFNPRLTIRSSIMFTLRASGTPRDLWRERIRTVMEQVGLSAHFAESYPHELSGGQLQRAAIARALVTEPAVIVCDEAVSALDKSVQAQVLNVLHSVQIDTGVGYLFISHDLTVVEHMSDRIAVMRGGQVIEHATPKELWSNPQHEYTRTLLDSVPGQHLEGVSLP
jgi:ABC-type glutathione transport system ATPase component